MIRLARILLYPVKSLDASPVDEATLTAYGALHNDRRFALLDAEGRFINGKRKPQVHGLRARYDDAVRHLCLGTADSEMLPFHVDQQRETLEQWLSEYFSMPVSLHERPEGGFPDDTNACGPTVLSSATLAEVARWFPGCDVEECRRRFRANLELETTDPFWEDQLYGDGGNPVVFHIGDVRLEGVNPCQRCVVPTRDSQTGIPLIDFTKTFRQRREATLPTWAPRSRFDHFYRLAVNTRVAASEAGKTMRVGDPVQLE